MSLPRVQVTLLMSELLPALPSPSPCPALWQVMLLLMGQAH